MKKENEIHVIEEVKRARKILQCLKEKLYALWEFSFEIQKVDRKQARKRNKIHVQYTFSNRRDS